MSKGKQNRDSITGERQTVIDDLGEGYKKSDGTFDPSAHPDSNIFNPRSFAAAAGFKSWRYFYDVVFTKAGSFWHTHVIDFKTYRKDGGAENARIIATHSDSAEAGGKLYREYQTKERRKRGTDVSPKNSE